MIILHTANLDVFKYKELDDRIVVIHQENKGLSSARNAGLKKAKGSLIGFVDGDDYIDVNMYQKLKENIDVEIIDELLMKLLQAPIEKERFKKEHCISAR